MSRHGIGQDGCAECGCLLGTVALDRNGLRPELPPLLVCEGCWQGADALDGWVGRLEPAEYRPGADRPGMDEEGTMTGMDGWLVIGNTPLDNVPLSLWPTEAEALAAARKTTLRSVQVAARHALGVDVSACVCVAVVEMRYGLPCPMRVVKDLAQEGG